MNVEQVIFSNGGGLGLITESWIDESDFINPQSVELPQGALSPGDYTNLNGMFTEAVRFAGLLKDNEHKIMCFHLGSADDLFEGNSYYSCFYWINKERIANKYKEGTVRDFIWKNNKWK